MTALLEIFRLLIAFLASGVFALFNVTLESKGDQEQRPEVRRTVPQIGSAQTLGPAAPSTSAPPPRAAPGAGYRNAL